MIQEEGRFVFEVDPSPMIVFDGTAVVDLLLKNPVANKLTYKIKCTSNAMFKIRPVNVGLVEPGKTTKVELLLLYDKPWQLKDDQHYIAIYHTPNPEGGLPRNVWAEHNGPATGTKRIFIQFRFDPPPAPDVVTALLRSEPRLPSDKRTHDEAHEGSDKSGKLSSASGSTA